jgi:hypothetical protein
MPVVFFMGRCLGRQKPARKQARAQFSAGFARAATGKCCAQIKQTLAQGTGHP